MASRLIRSIEKRQEKEKEWDEQEKRIRDRATGMALLFACRSGDSVVLRFILEKMDGDANSAVSHMLPSLQSAICHVRADNPRDVKARLKCVELLLEHGADINMRDGAGDTPLATAIRKGCLEIAELLIDRGAVIMGITADGENVIEVAANERPRDGVIIEMLKARYKEMFLDFWTAAAQDSPGGL
ncbi:MAG: ankyrin repeat domain-containing protein [Syntrophorhabdales bacterium]|jgi:hypothetical protein